MMKLSEALHHFGVPLETFASQDVDTVLLFGAFIGRDDAHLLGEVLGSELPFVALSTMEDPRLGAFYKYEAGTEEGVLGILTKALYQGTDPSLEVFFDALDEGYLSAECNVGEEEALEVATALQGRRVMCVLGADLEHHFHAPLLAQWLKLLSHVATVSFVMAGHEATKVQTLPLELPQPPEVLESFDGTIAYACPALTKEEESQLLGSRQFGIAAKVKHGDTVEIHSALGVQVRTFYMDEAMKGTVALLPYAHVPAQFRYVHSTIKQVG
ncbi:MAG: hypothetical protein IBX45_03275 [Campylobacterales bacterium]|nr:hypothetical protein [Campylobacterales bacterium]